MNRVGIHATCPQAIASIALMHAAMDDQSDYAVTLAARDQLTDDQIEALTDAADKQAAADDLDDMKHALRSAWHRAIDNQHALSTPKLPTVDGGRVVMVPVTELVGTLMDLNFSVQLLSDALRTGDVTKLHVHLRQFYVDGYAADLVRLDWRDA